MRCDECQFWQLDDKEMHEIKGLGRCTKAMQLWDATEWVPDDDGEPGWCDRRVKAEHADQMSFCNDGSQYSASLWTKAEFFCAHFTKVS